MPRKYPDETKQEAASMLQIQHAIPIPPDSLSTLSVLSEKVFSLSAKRTKSDKVQTETHPKTNPLATPDAAMQPPARANTRPGAARPLNMTDSAILLRRRPPNGWGYPPPPPVQILYLYTMPKHGYFMGILWAFTRTFAPRSTVCVSAPYGQCRRAVSAVSVEGRCRRAVSTRPTCPTRPTVSVYATLGGKEI